MLAGDKWKDADLGETPTASDIKKYVVNKNLLLMEVESAYYVSKMMTCICVAHECDGELVKVQHFFDTERSIGSFRDRSVQWVRRTEITVYALLPRREELEYKIVHKAPLGSLTKIPCPAGLDEAKDMPDTHNMLNDPTTCPCKTCRKIRELRKIYESKSKPDSSTDGH